MGVALTAAGINFPLYIAQHPIANRTSNGGPRERTIHLTGRRCLVSLLPAPYSLALLDML
jgi:hypothetical protein